MAMQIVEEISVALTRMTWVAGAIQRAEHSLDSTITAIESLLVSA